MSLQDFMGVVWVFGVAIGIVLLVVWIYCVSWLHEIRNQSKEQTRLLQVLANVQVQRGPRDARFQESVAGEFTAAERTAAERYVLDDPPETPGRKRPERKRPGGGRY